MANWTLKILVDSETKGAESNLKGLGGVLKDLPDKLHGIGAAGLAGMGALGAAAMGAAGGMAKLAIDAAPMANIHSAFDALAKSVGTSGDAMLAALQKASGGMIPQIDLMKSFNLAAQLVGDDFAKRLPEAMGYLSKVSAATGEDMSFMLDSLIRGVGRLSPMILDNLGIQVSLEEATARAAEMFGVEADQLTKAQIQAGMMDVVLGKLKDNTAGMPEVAGTANASLGQMNTMFTNLKMMLGEAFLPVLQPILQAFAGLGQQYLPQVVAVAQELGEKLGGLVTALINTGINSEQTRTALANLIGPELADTILNIINVVSDLGGKFIEFVTTHAEEFKTAVLAIAAVFAAAGIAEAIGAIIGVITALANPITAIILVIGLLATAWAENWGGIQEKTRAALEFIQNIISTVLGAIKDFWKQHGDTIISIASTAWDVVKGIFQFFFDFISGLVQSSLDFWRGLWDQHGGTITSIADSTWGKMKSAFQSAFDFIRDLVQSGLDFMRNLWDQHGGFITEIARRYWEAVKGIFEMFFSVFRELFEALLAALQGDWYNFGVNLREAVEALWAGIRDTFIRFRDIIMDIFKYMLTRLVEAVRGIDWVSVGTSIVEGIKNGVMNMARALADAAVAVVRAALEAAKGALGIKSPSREFQAVGQDAMLGLERGIESYSGRVLSSLDGLLGQVREKLGQVGQMLDDPRLQGINVIDDPRLRGINVIDDPRLRVPKLIGEGGIKTPDDAGIANVIDDPRLRVPKPIGGGGVKTPVGGGGGGGGGGGARGGGGGGSSCDSRIVELLTDIRDILAEEFGIDESRFAGADLAYSLRGARA